MAVNEIEDPKFDPKEIYGIVGSNLTKTFDVREVICKSIEVVDYDYLLGLNIEFSSPI